MFLFGGDRLWSPGDWTDSDDRVRGGKSQSFWQCSTFEPVARFYGELDIKTLGGAGFGSQRTTGENRTWDLSNYDGIELRIAKADSKKYTLTLKDELLPKNPDNGREQSTVSYEYEFVLDSEGSNYGDDQAVFIPFKDLKPTYRGREKKDAKPPNLKSVKRLSILMRSFFGEQEGPFSLSIRSISAFKNRPANSHQQQSSDTFDLEAKITREHNYYGQTGSKRRDILKRCSHVFLLVIVGGLFYAVYQGHWLVPSRL